MPIFRKLQIRNARNGGATTYNIMTFSKTILSIMGLFATLSINDTQRNITQSQESLWLVSPFYYYSERHFAVSVC